MKTETAPMAFTFGEPEPVVSTGGLMDYTSCWLAGRWYEPPVNLHGLSKSTRASVYLESGLKFKRNMLLKQFRPSKLLSRECFDRFAQDFLWSGNGYLEASRNGRGELIGLRACLAKYMRRGVKPGQYFQVHHWQEEHEFARDSIVHIIEPDIHQELYGLPEWLAALQSAFLNESATLFRRKYYNNGSHAGFILYMNDPAQNEEDIAALRKALRDAKGPGNFRNLFMYSPGGKKDGIQVIPVSEVAAKDEFNNIKNITRDDLLAALRIPPQLMGVVPSNAGGFGSIRDAADVWQENELGALQERLRQVNHILGQEVIQFKPLPAPT